MEKSRLDTHYAWLRTRLSVENTLMGWIRTTTSLIGVGVLALAFAIWRYHETMRYLAAAEFADVDVDASFRLRGWRSPYVVAGLLTLIGVVTFFWILLGG